MAINVHVGMIFDEIKDDYVKNLIFEIFTKQTCISLKNFQSGRKPHAPQYFFGFSHPASQS